MVNVRHSLPDLKKLVQELDKDVLIRAIETADRRRIAGSIFSDREGRAGGPGVQGLGGRTIWIRWRWRGCSPASLSGSWKTTT